MLALLLDINNMVYLIFNFFIFSDFTGPGLDVCPSNSSLYGQIWEMFTTGWMWIVFGRCNLTALSPTSFVMSYGPTLHSVSSSEVCDAFRLLVESQTLLLIWYLGAIDLCLSAQAFICVCAFSRLDFVWAGVFCIIVVNFSAAGALVVLCYIQFVDYRTMSLWKVISK